jgi:hypothetical protein
LKIHFKIILPSRPRSSKWFLFLRFPHQNPICTSPVPRMCYIPSPRTCEMFCNIISFYGEEFLAPCPTSKLEDHPLSAVRDCLFKIFAATLHIWRPFLHLQPKDVPYYGYRDPVCLANITVWYWKIWNSVVQRPSHFLEFCRKSTFYLYLQQRLKHIKCQCTLCNTKVVIIHLLGMSNRQYKSNPLPDRWHQEPLALGRWKLIQLKTEKWGWVSSHM